MVAFVWLLLSGLTVTTSSIGAFGVATDSEVSGLVAGTPKTIRGDEFARNTPLLLGVMESGSTNFVTPLTNQPFLTTGIPSTNVVEMAIFPERALLRLGPILPDGAAFSFVFWFPVACTLLFLPYVLVAWGARFSHAVAGTLLVVLSPSAAWWSWGPLTSIAPGLLASATVIAGVRYGGRSTWLVRILLTLVAGAALARVPWSYFPWSLPLSGSIFAVSIAVLVCTRGKAKVTLVLAGCAAAISIAATAVVLITNSVAFTALSETVYPGARRASGEALEWSFVFGAPFLGVLQDQPQLVNYNPSELSSSWNIAIVVWVLAAVTAWVNLDRVGRAHVVTVGFILLVGYSWVLIDWPIQLGESIPGLNLIEPNRMTAIIGILAVASTSVLLASVRARVWVAACGAVAVSVILVPTGLDMSREVIPSMTVSNTVIPVVIVAVIVLLVLSPSPRAVYIGLVLSVVGATAIVYKVGPIQHGLGALRNGEAAMAIANEVDASVGTEDPYWAADGVQLGSLLAANGVPAVSGEAWTGPSELWLALDPSGQYEPEWNRAVSVVQFSWDDSLADPVIKSPQPDLVVISVSPCDPALKKLQIGHIISSRELSSACLTPAGVTEWSGLNAYLYQLQ